MDSKQVLAIITKYVKDHPEVWHLPLSIEAFNALNAACPGGLMHQRPPEAKPRASRRLTYA